MRYNILLNLEGSIQSWGESAKNGDLTTLDHPTKSGVLGIVLCSMGISGEGRIEVTNQCDVDCYVLKSGSILKDFQTIGIKYDKNDVYQQRYLIRKNNNGKVGAIADCPTAIFNKYYLYNAHFIAIVKTDNEVLAKKIQNALVNPYWQPFLGRKCNIPSIPIACREGVLTSHENILNAIKSRTDNTMVLLYTESEKGTPYMDNTIDKCKYSQRLVEAIKVNLG